MFGRKSTRQRAIARFERLFSKAGNELEQSISAIIAKNAANGALQSGATIKASVRATSEIARSAVNEALSGIASLTDHAGSTRKAMIAALLSVLPQHMERLEGKAIARMTKLGMGNDMKHAAPLFAAERRRLADLISDFGEGWTAPTGKRWHERHPILAGVVIAVISAGIGWAANSRLSQGSETQDVQKAGHQANPQNVAPDVTRKGALRPGAPKNPD